MEESSLSPDMLFETLKSLREVWAKYQQEQAFRWVHQLNHSELVHFLEDVQQIDIAEADRIYKTTVAREEKAKEEKHDVKPFPNVTRFSDMNKEQRAKWENIGYNLIAEGKLAILLLAGGQASRLGCLFPKGLYDIGLPSGKSLFQIQVERSIKLQKLAARHVGKEYCRIPWYIMTSPATYQPTVDFFKEMDYFGQDPRDFFFFNQHMQPCMTPAGKIINEAAGRIALAPNGNGGLYKALYTSGALADMSRRGVEYVSQYCVDNALVRVADPVFVGFMHDMGADCAAKVVSKAFPEEPVGVMCLVDGKPGVIEYSEIDPSLRNLVDSSSNQLVYNYAHICVNNFSRKFLERIAADHLSDLRHHVAKKKIPYANEDGKTMQPEKENGWKLEMFIFDAFQYSHKMVALEVHRDEEFSPLKNGPGMAVPKDSPETCLADMCRLHLRYIVKAGGSIITNTTHSCDDTGSSAEPKTNTKSAVPQVPLVEVNPLLSYAGEDLEPIVRNRSFPPPIEIKE